MKKQTRYKRGIRFRAVQAICGAALIVTVIGLSTGYFLGVKLLRNLIGENYAGMATLLANSVHRIVSEEVGDIRTYADSPFWKKATEESNLKYETMSPEAVKRFFSDMDKKWKEATADCPLVTKYLECPLGIRLKKLVKNDRNIVEIFVTDKKGALVAASGKTSDFYQADEKWWLCAFDAGEGKLCLQKIVFDESVGKFVVPIAVPIRDESGEAIGVCKSLESIERFMGHLRDFTIGKTGHAALVDEEGNIVVHKGIEPFSIKFAKKEVLQRVYSTKRRWDIIRDPHAHKKRIFVSYAKIENPYLAKSGIEWVVFINRDLKTVFAPLYRLFLQMFVVVSIVLLSIIPVAFIFGGVFVKPIQKLSKATKEIAKGDLDYHVEIKTGDEIEELAASFGKMIVAIKERQKTIAEGRDKFENLSKNLDRKVEERTGELESANEAMLNMMEDLQEAKEGLEKAMVIKSNFISMVSHELRTPLTAIKEGIAIVLDGIAGELNSEQKDFLDTAKRNVDRLARLINDVLDFQKLEAGRTKFNIQERDINEIVSEVEKEMIPSAREKKLTLISKLDKKMPRVKLDRDAIIQVLINLINNAVKFTEKGGIVITTGYDRKNNTVSVSVKDTGPGIQKEDMPRIFQRFEQLEMGGGRKTGSSGLGLAISREIIKRHRGKIWAKSQPGKGTTFYFVLPIKERRG